MPKNIENIILIFPDLYLTGNVFEYGQINRLICIDSKLSKIVYVLLNEIMSRNNCVRSGEFIYLYRRVKISFLKVGFGDNLQRF